MRSVPVVGKSGDLAVVLTVVSGSHVLNHTYLVLFPPVLGVLATEFDASLATLGLVIGAQALANALFQLPYGHLADTYDRTLTLGLCLAIGAGGVLVLALAPTLEWLVVGQVLVGIGVAGHHPAHYPLLSDASSVDHRGRAFSVHSVFGNIGFATPAAVIVAVASLPGMYWRHAFGVMGVAGLLYGTLAVYVLLTRVPAEVRKPSETAESPGSEATYLARFREGTKALFDSPAILSLGVLALFASAVVWGLSTYVVTFLEQGYGVGSSVASLTLTGMYVAGAVLILVGGDLTDRFGPGPIIIAGYVLAGALVFVLALTVVPPLAAVAVAIAGGSLCSFTLPARDTLTDLLSERGDLGRNFAIITIGYMISQTVAPPVFGALIDGAGFRVAFIAIAAAAAVTLGLVSFVLTMYREDFAVGTAVADD